MSRYKALSAFFMGISIIGLFGPWLFFAHSVDYRTGIQSQPGIMFVGYTLFFIFIYLKGEEAYIRVTTTIGAGMVVIGCIYDFLTWHIMTITGEFNLRVSFSTAHDGFYLTFITSIISLIIYTYGCITKKL
ncbi:MAG: hypothetical protein RSA01_05130 [Clostridium sp.]|uniref:hypothetical protein n=1 Tax=Clostridium sp. TaxID=1506 RepID=UPI002FC8A69E